jgi:subtilisin family serine protease
VINKTNDPFDDHGHGTHVAGIIAADLNNSGIAGAAPKARIYAIKALAADGTGYISDLITAIDWAITNNLQLLNFSLGTTYDSSLLRHKIQDAAGRGIIITAAAGNTNGGALLYPAAYNEVIAVSATDSKDNFASFSSLGAEVAAPGVSIRSTVPGGRYATWSGTSMAAPHVTATLALMLANGQLDVRQQLRDTATDLGPAGKDSYFVMA